MKAAEWFMLAASLSIIGFFGFNGSVKFTLLLAISVIGFIISLWKGC